jgi:hypothetical protein
MIPRLFLILITIAITTADICAQNSFIQVVSEPGQTVYLNEVLKGQITSDIGGLIIESVSAGQNSIKIIKEGFNPQDEKILIRDGEVFTFTVKPFVPKIRICEEGNVGQQKIELSVGKIA